MKYPLGSPEALRSEPSLFEPDPDEPAKDPDAWPSWMLASLCPWLRDEDEELTNPNPIAE